MTAELQPTETAPSEASTAAEIQRTEKCGHCGHPLGAVRRTAPFSLLLSVARLLIAAGAALALMAIVVSLLRGGWFGFAPSELWSLFALFLLSIGVLVLYEIRDLLLRQATPPASANQPLTHSVPTPLTGVLAEWWRTIGWLACGVWLPFQSKRERLLIDHLAVHEQHELFNRLAVVAVCIVATTVAPVLIAFFFLSPEAVCFAVTAIAANLFVFDWFKKRHKRWLYATSYARQQAIVPPGE